jgi:hypothetical protein
MQQRSTSTKRAVAALIAISAIATAVPATSYADGGGSPPPASQGGGGSGGGP